MTAAMSMDTKAAKASLGHKQVTSTLQVGLKTFNSNPL